MLLQELLRNNDKLKTLIKVKKLNVLTIKNINKI